MLALQLLVLLIVANSLPVLARDLLGGRWNRPLDGGRLWRDGRPLLGASKTVRGLLTALAGSALAGWALGLGAGFGALFGALAMLGDLLSSFAKRRLGLDSSARATGLDQIPEALLPVLFAMAQLPLGVGAAASVVALFFVLEVALSPLLFRLGLRGRPY